MANGTPSGWGYVAINLGSAWRYQAAGDVNRDGFADVVIQDASGNVYVANMAGGHNSGYLDLGNIAGYQVRAVGDVNADGYADVIVQRESDGWTLWRDLSGSGPEWNVASNPVGTSWILKDTADVDNDGSADLIYQHSTTGETLYRAMDNGVGSSWQFVTSPLGAEWVVV
jgi:hypothetical protein